MGTSICLVLVRTRIVGRTIVPPRFAYAEHGNSIAMMMAVVMGERLMMRLHSKLNGLL
jgi:hypothetical protein